MKYNIAFKGKSDIFISRVISKNHFQTNPKRRKIR